MARVGGVLDLRNTQFTTISSLAEALQPLGEVWVVAPERQQSASSHSLTLHKPLRAREHAERVISISGTPTDCVMLGVREFVAPRLMPEIGIGAESALAMQLVTYLVQVAVSLVGGVIFGVMLIQGRLRLRPRRDEVGN